MPKLINKRGTVVYLGEHILQPGEEQHLTEAQLVALQESGFLGADGATNEDVKAVKDSGDEADKVPAVPLDPKLLVKSAYNFASPQRSKKPEKPPAPSADVKALQDQVAALTKLVRAQAAQQGQAPPAPPAPKKHHKKK